MIIDSHQHFWKLNLPFDYSWLETRKHGSIYRDFLPTDLQPFIEAAEVDRTVVVQTQHNLNENRWILNLADRFDFIAGVVGWVDLASERCEEQLLEFKDLPKFVGIRHIAQDEPDDDFIVRPDILRGLKVLEDHQVPFDLLFYSKHLKHAADLARCFDELPMVVDHLAKPRIREGVLDSWRGDLLAAAEFQNIYCKLSGLVTEADWDNWRPSDLKPFVETALEAFGPERCMFGSDWPVCELAASYQKVFDTLADVLGPLSQSETAEIFGGTATRFYGLAVDDTADQL